MGPVWNIKAFLMYSYRRSSTTPHTRRRTRASTRTSAPGCERQHLLHITELHCCGELQRPQPRWRRVRQHLHATTWQFASTLPVVADGHVDRSLDHMMGTWRDCHGERTGTDFFVNQIWPMRWILAADPDWIVARWDRRCPAMGQGTILALGWDAALTALCQRSCEVAPARPCC